MKMKRANLGLPRLVRSLDPSANQSPRCTSVCGVAEPPWVHRRAVTQAWTWTRRKLRNAARSILRASHTVSAVAIKALRAATDATNQTPRPASSPISSDEVPRNHPVADLEPPRP